MVPNSRRRTTQPTRIPINTLSGGVGRQAPSKRLPSEAQELINALCSTERSIEKRPGTDLMPIKRSDAIYTGDKLNVDSTENLEFFWHALSDQLRYLIAIDRSATQSTDTLFYIWYFDQAADEFLDITPADQDSPADIPDEVRAYLTYGTSPLRIVTRGQNLIWLNPDVYAGYTSKPFTITQALIDAGEISIDGVLIDAVDGGGNPIFEDGQVIWLTLDLDGDFKTTGTAPSLNYIEDIKGGEEEYLTALKVDPAGLAVFWDSYSPYIIGTQVLVVPGSTEIHDQAGGTGHDNGIHAAENWAANGNNTSPHYSGPIQYYYLLKAKQTLEPDQEVSDNTNWTVIATDNPEWDTAIAATFTGGGGTAIPPALDTDRTPKRIPVQNWQYPDSTERSLGQSLPTFNDLRIPPLQVDVTDGNNNAQDMLVALYGLETSANPDEPLTNSADGKIYYIQAGYQGQSPGYYLAKSVASPSFQKIRTPDAYSVLDKNRMPMQLEFTTSSWQWSTIDWAHRTAGDKDNNTGPESFKDGRQVKISTIASFRNRLWFSVGDTMFSSRMDEWTDLWLDDPGLLTDTDPIDIAASTNTYTPITAMVPFREYMFVNTEADTQYQLEGSQNEITPFTATLQPMTFYSTAPLIEPLTLGNNIFFYDAERLYIYYGVGGTLATAQELSAHCPKYLPSSFGATAVAAAQDSILVVDDDTPSDIYYYTTKYRGNEILQNAFYRFTYEDANIKSMKAWDNYVYMVIERDTGLFIERQYLRDDDISIPRLDRKRLITVYNKSTPLDGTDTSNPKWNGSAFNAYIDNSSVTTTLRVPYVLDVSSSYDFVSQTGDSFTITNISTPTSTYTDITIAGILEDGQSYWLGRQYLMLIQLSTPFVRDGNNNPRQGVLNISSITTKHYNTGNYDILVSRRGRPVEDIEQAYLERDPQLYPYLTAFAAPRVDTFDESNLEISNIEYQGELVSKVLGFSEKIEMYILSDYFTPVNITNIALRGKFKDTSSSLT